MNSTSDFFNLEEFKNNLKMIGKKCISAITHPNGNYNVTC